MLHAEKREATREGPGNEAIPLLNLAVFCVNHAVQPVSSCDRSCCNSTASTRHFSPVCSDADYLENTICCPTTSDGICGENANRGQCVSLATPPSNDTADVRANWPHYFTQIRQCNGNYGGYDCSRCKFGYYGENCGQFQVLPRRPLRDYTDEEWTELNSILHLTKTHESDYVIILD